MKINQMTLEDKDSITFFGEGDIKVNKAAFNMVILSVGDDLPDPIQPPPASENWVPNGMLGGPSKEVDVSHWEWDKDYFYNCVKDPNNCGMHGALRASDARVVFVSPSLTRYWQYDWDKVKINGEWIYTRNTTWPEEESGILARDRVFTVFSAGAYDPDKGIYFGYEEAGHIHENPGGPDDGSVWKRLSGRVGDGQWELIHEDVGMTALFGAGKVSPVGVILHEGLAKGTQYTEFMVELEAELRTYNAGGLFGDVKVGAM